MLTNYIITKYSDQVIVCSFSDLNGNGHKNTSFTFLKSHHT